MSHLQRHVQQLKFLVVKKKQTKTISVKVKNQLKKNGSEFNLVIIIDLILILLTLILILLTACRDNSFTYCEEANSYTS